MSVRVGELLLSDEEVIKVFTELPADVIGKFVCNYLLCEVEGIFDEGLHEDLRNDYVLLDHLVSTARYIGDCTGNEELVDSFVPNDFNEYEYLSLLCKVIEAVKYLKTITGEHYDGLLSDKPENLTEQFEQLQLLTSVTKYQQMFEELCRIQIDLMGKDVSAEEEK